MSGIPHTIPKDTTQPGLGTPADEWASKTTSMLEPHTTNVVSSINSTSRHSSDETFNQDHPNSEAQSTFVNSSVVSTPGVQLPGAYHPGPEEQTGSLDYKDAANKVSESIQQAAQSVGTTAASYLPAAAQYLPTSVVETVANYIPIQQITEPVQASTHDILHQKSLPSQELSGQGSGERITGAGSLPGSIAESGVARLPDDRSQPGTPSVSSTTLFGRLGADLSSASSATGALGGVTEKAKVVLPVPMTASGNRDLPSSETPTISHTSGVGSLPGTNIERDVAILPDEKLAESTTNAANLYTGTHHAAGGDISKLSDEGEDLLTGATTTLPNSRQESGFVKPNNLSSQELYSNETQKTALDAGRQDVQDGVGPLVGSGDESEVGMIPDECAQQETSIVPPYGDKGERSEPGGVIGMGAATTTKDEKNISGNHGLPNKSLGYQTDHHPAEPNPPTHNALPSGDYSTPKGALGNQNSMPVANERNTDVDQIAEKPRIDTDIKKKGGPDGTANEATSSPTSSKSSEGKKKVGFMKRMKGEAKMLLGKIEGKQAKVEEGRRMKAGEIA